ncbi:MAG: hypothetical protein JO093_08545 [Acidobacteria bacterium]|nr:hypothetical protein [Acidobacteriota bacterium]MBV9071434.1 hypothetical protein [Acidobacteriota bacterium]MBV9185658.1 hypothetical protein [Acidobacteriota bacterium]
MKKLILASLLTLAASTLLAGEGKSCEMKSKGKPVSLSGTVACKGDDCTFTTAKSTYAVCEMSKADVPKLASAGTVNVTGKLITCEGKQKLVIDKAGK